MKDRTEIVNDKRIIVKSRSDDGMNGYITLKGKTFFFIASWGGGWDHLSVSLSNRCPTWDEMCIFKDMFFSEDEACVEYHPAKKDYVNIWPYCLHIWKPQNVELPKPPTIYV